MNTTYAYYYDNAISTRPIRETEEYFKRQSKSKRRKKNSFIYYYKLLSFFIICIVSLILIVNLISLFVDLCKYPEEYLSTWNYQLACELNEGDEDAIAYYTERYVANNNYIYDGPITIKLMANKYNLDADVLYNIYIGSGYNSAQEFHDDYVQYIATCQEFIDTYCTD